jgi:hypothetical protein
MPSHLESSTIFPMDTAQTLASLLQPALIRLIDNLRKQLTPSGLKWDYETLEEWSEDVSPATRDRVATLTQALEVADPEDAEHLQAELDQLPVPIPMYWLAIAHPEQPLRVNLWELCYQVCLESYAPNYTNTSLSQPDLSHAQIDGAILDDQGEIDWAQLDQKAAAVVQEFMNSLPKDPS